MHYKSILIGSQIKTQARPAAAPDEFAVAAGATAVYSIQHSRCGGVGIPDDDPRPVSP